MKKEITLSGSSEDKKIYKEALHLQSSKGLLSYDGSKYPVIFAGKIGGKRTLVLLADKKSEKSEKVSDK